MKIIAIDSSMTVLSKIENLLQQISINDLEISLFTNTNDAIEFIDDNDVNLIFSSIETEGMDGITFAEMILRKYPSLISKLFIVTSQKNSDDFKEMKEVGAKRFIQKPINDEYFIHFVKPEIYKVLNIES